jgi:hypothetical protein
VRPLLYAEAAYLLAVVPAETAVASAEDSGPLAPASRTWAVTMARVSVSARTAHFFHDAFAAAARRRVARDPCLAFLAKTAAALRAFAAAFAEYPMAAASGAAIAGELAVGPVVVGVLPGGSLVAGTLPGGSEVPGTLPGGPVVSSTLALTTTMPS